MRVLVLVSVIVVRPVLVGVFVHRPVGVFSAVLVLGGGFVFVPVIGIAVAVLVTVGHAVGVRVGVSVLVFRRHDRRFASTANAPRSWNYLTLMLAARNPEIVAFGPHEGPTTAWPAPTGMAPTDGVALVVNDAPAAFRSARSQTRDKFSVRQNVL